jgi:predicted RNA-binding Zn-ribbon protein involved in translation (DUF1610 family)
MSVEEIKTELPKFEFMMFNRANREGELTLLDQKDIDDILFDLNRGVKANYDENGMIVITYPYNVCRLESRNLISKICPSCKINELNKDESMNALSRKDNTTYICDDCGTAEGLEELYKWKE